MVLSALVFSMIFEILPSAIAHQPVNLLATDTTPIKGPLLVEAPFPSQFEQLLPKRARNELLGPHLKMVTC